MGREGKEPCTDGSQAVGKSPEAEVLSGNEVYPGGSKMAELERELERTGVALDAVLERYRLRSAEQMTPEIYGKAMECLRKSKSRKAA